MRSKEEAHDYRYFPEPDLMPIITTDEKKVEEIRQSLPELPDRRKVRYVKEYNITDYDASLLIASRKMADYFEATVRTAKK